jgi:SAM-dependent methyltransferase
MTTPKLDSGFRCRSCGSSAAVPILSLGTTPLANALLSAEDLPRPEPRFPLDVVFCTECALVQITETVPPQLLFAEYPYFSSFSDTAVDHAKQLAARVREDRGLNGSSLVMEIASNDGYLLQHYASYGVPVLGIEPAYNIATVARERGIPTLNEFFGAQLASELAASGRQADVIHSHNVLAHVPDLNGFVSGVRQMLRRGGVAIVEVPWVRELVRNLEFDTIYHEHLSYFSLTALARLFERHAFVVADVEVVPIHGGSLRLWIANASEASRGPRVEDLLRREQAEGLTRPGYFSDFGTAVRRLTTDLRELLKGLKQGGRTIAAYGASAKGSTLLNVAGIGRETLDFVVDRSTVKQGRYTPGTHLPIRPPEALLAEMPSHVLLLTWNFADEILRQQDEYRRRGGKFILPLPAPAVI